MGRHSEMCLEQYANMPFTLNLSADDIVTAYTVEERMVLTVEDNDLTFDTDIELDVRDAPAREVIIETSPEWSQNDTER